MRACVLWFRHLAQNLGGASQQRCLPSFACWALGGGGPAARATAYSPAASPATSVAPTPRIPGLRPQTHLQNLAAGVPSPLGQSATTAAGCHTPAFAPQHRCSSMCLSMPVIPKAGPKRRSP
eukprot:11219204-Alexandrium_andersonii.AAC.1